ncbi:MAG: septation protein SpoVG family protein [Candidatus Omnitrophota bacterium]
MEITEVKVILKEGQDKKLKAYATLTLDNCFVVRNIKVIKGTKGLFVAMPSRKMREACPKCHYKNPVRSRFCNQCGASLPPPPAREMGDEIKQSEHRDIAHPITLECREYIQKKVLDAYEVEVKRTGAPPEEAPMPKAETPKEEAPMPKAELPEEKEAPPEKPETAPAPTEEKPPPEEPGDITL